ncbi:hypothetical protein VK792_17880 [Mesobacterium sp. TK19101]|uniref:DUF4386 family protein n=1 Tax=Mesobacterium hydrothermale TaxID=3111907 RepID=A0ABU6HLC6_9RHOB|nr:hypothetical protein [Mesobacterium sp. TK19101]MEC3863167.1 hypothetical protein [Mesobacterium sp. TK19101]
MSFSHAAAGAALICAATYVIGFAVLLTVLAPLGFGSEQIDAQAVTAFVHAHPLEMIAWNTLIYIVNALALVVLVVGLSLRLRGHQSGLAAMAQALGLIWAGLVLGAGMVANVAVERVVSLFAETPELAVQMWSILHAVELGLGGGNEIAGGAWLLTISLAERRAATLPGWLVVLGVLAGGAGMVTVVPPLGQSAGVVFGLGTLLWFGGVGLTLLRATPPAQV